VLADHARAVAFLLADGVYPSNEGRGYVLRRILRRAVRHAWLLGRREPTLTPLTEVVVGQMGDVYPELRAKADFIADVTRNEEERFLETIEGGLARLDELLATGARTIAGEDAFRLYDTFGFPIDLTQLLARERGVEVDVAGFEEALEEQRERSRSDRAGRKGGSMSAMFSGGDFRVHSPAAQTFVGYAAT
jgi:alanyl-tRNA synthetase